MAGALISLTEWSHSEGFLPMLLLLLWLSASERCSSNKEIRVMTLEYKYYLERSNFRVLILSPGEFTVLQVSEGDDQLILEY